MGKTVTTEFAFFPPGKTANPVNLDYTPGGSSSGSAAAVADGMVPVAFGTQTNASVTRPAAFCGVVGYKMSFGHFSMTGIKPFSPSLDTLGMFVRTVDDLPLMRSAMLGIADAPPRDAGAPSVAVCFTPEYGEPDTTCTQRIDDVARRFADAGARVGTLQLPPVFGRLLEEQEKILGFEAQQSFLYERDQGGQDVHPDFRQFLEERRAITLADYLGALDYTQACRHALAQAREDFDILLTPGVFGEAPHGRDWTGSPLFCRIWTLLHLPTISLPAGSGPNGMPMGVQLVGRANRDEDLIAAASWAEATLARHAL